MLIEITAEAAVVSMPSSLHRFWFELLLVLFIGTSGDAGRAVPDGWSGLGRSSGDLDAEDLFLFSLCESGGSWSTWFLSWVAPTPGLVGEIGLMWKSNVDAGLLLLSFAACLVRGASDICQEIVHPVCSLVCYFNVPFGLKHRFIGFPLLNFHFGTLLVTFKDQPSSFCQP